jgi:hypothetical protein
LYIPIITEIDDLAREMFEKQRKFQAFLGNPNTEAKVKDTTLALSFVCVYINSVQITTLNER